MPGKEVILIGQVSNAFFFLGTDHKNFPVEKIQSLINGMILILSIETRLLSSYQCLKFMQCFKSVCWHLMHKSAAC